MRDGASRSQTETDRRGPEGGRCSHGHTGIERTKAAAREGVDRQLATRKEAVNNPAKDKEKWPRASNAHGAHACKVTGVVERNEVVLAQLISVNWRETADPGVEA